MRCTTRFSFGSTALFNLYQWHAAGCVDGKLVLHAVDTCLVFTDRDIKTIEEHQNRDFSTLVNLFTENKLNVHFGEDKTKSILFFFKTMIEINRTNRYLVQGH